MACEFPIAVKAMCMLTAIHCLLTFTYFTVEMLSRCCTNNTNRWRISLRSTFSNCRVLLRYLHSLVHASLNYRTASMRFRGCYQQTRTTHLVGDRWTVTVIIRFRLPLGSPELLITPHNPPPAHRCGRGSPWWMDTNFRRQGVWAGEFSTGRKQQFYLPTCIFRPR